MRLRRDGWRVAYESSDTEVRTGWMGKCGGGKTEMKEDSVARWIRPVNLSGDASEAAVRILVAGRGGRRSIQQQTPKYTGSGYWCKYG